VYADYHGRSLTPFGVAGCVRADLPAGTLPQQQHKHKLRKLGERTSSAEWTHDRLTWQEDITYKKELGYL
jgi:hypothetical protein